jgi:hypothetical protein
LALDRLILARFLTRPLEHFALFNNTTDAENNTVGFFALLTIPAGAPTTPMVVRNDKTNTLRFGLTAGEVAQADPVLVIRNKNGEPLTVRNEKINAMF